MLDLRGGSDALCAALLDPILSGDPRFVRHRTGAWELGEPGTAARTAPARTWSYTLWVIEPHLAVVAAVRIEAERVVEERLECSRHPRTALGATALGRLARLSRGTTWVHEGTAASMSGLRARLHAVAAMRDSPIVVSLRQMALAVGAPRPGERLDDLIAWCGLGRVAEGGPLDRARAAATCLLYLLDQLPLARARSPEELAAVVLARPAPPDLSGRSFDADTLAALPAAAGTYRFLDASGALLYVGKARNLRARVGTYFAPRRRPDPRTAPWLHRVDRIEIERAGSELEALLAEAEAIARDRPVHNIQRRIHRRSRTASGNLVLLLPASGPGRVRAYLVREGAIAARILLGPGSRGIQRLRARLERIYFVRTAAASPRMAMPKQERSRALLASWLARQNEAAPAFDPTDAPDAGAAVALARRYAESVAKGERGVIHR